MKLLMYFTDFFITTIFRVLFSSTTFAQDDEKNLKAGSRASIINLKSRFAF